MGVDILTEEVMTERHRHGVSLYPEWRRFALEVERVYKGNFGPKGEDPPGDLEILRPSDGYALVHKFLRMLSIRSTMTYESPRADDTRKATERADRLEQVTRGYYDELRYATQRNLHRDAVFYALLRGKGAIQTIFDPTAQLKIRQEALDPFEYFVVPGKEGPRWFTTERYMQRIELWDYFEGLTPRQLKGVNVPALWPDPDNPDEDRMPWDWLPVIEYWDDEWFGWKVGNHLVATDQHGYGFVPLAEIPFNQTPLSDERWGTMALIGAAVEDLKNLATLRSKMATGVNQFYFPRLYYADPDGGIHVADANTPIGEFGEVAPDFKPIVLNPQVNHEALQLLMGNLQSAVGNTTINPMVFDVDLSGAPSGFSVSQFLSIVKDDLADYVDSLQVGLSIAASHLLKMMHAKVGEVPGGRWSFPVRDEKGGRRRLVSVGKDDLEDNFKMLVHVRVDLPQDTLQKSSIFNQLYQDGQDGKPRIDFRTALELSGLEYSIEDIAAMEKRIDWAWARRVDPEIQAAEIARIKAEHAGELDDWGKIVDKEQRKQERREEAREIRNIERGLSEDVIYPQELANPQAVTQIGLMLESGMTLQGAIDTLMNGGLPLGVPGQQSAVPEGAVADPELQLLISALGKGGPGMGNLAGGLPDGFEGYDGLDTAALPPAMQGAQPRRVMDQPRVQVEDEQRNAMRGGLPPRR